MEFGTTLLHMHCLLVDDSNELPGLVVPKIEKDVTKIIVCYNRG